MIDIAGLLAAAVLLVTLTALEVRHVGPHPGQQGSSKLIVRALNDKIVIGVMWLVFLLLLLPRVLGLLT